MVYFNFSVTYNCYDNIPEYRLKFVPEQVKNILQHWANLKCEHGHRFFALSFKCEQRNKFKDAEIASAFLKA